MIFGVFAKSSKPLKYRACRQKHRFGPLRCGSRWKLKKHGKSDGFNGPWTSGWPWNDGFGTPWTSSWTWNGVFESPWTGWGPWSDGFEGPWTVLEWLWRLKVAAVAALFQVWQDFCQDFCIDIYVYMNFRSTAPAAAMLLISISIILIYC